MKIALLHNHYDKDHLSSVMDEMRVLGAPTIKAVWMECWGVWAALEGCHRIRAASKLGMVPVIDEIEYSEEITTEEIGLGDFFDGDVWTIAELADEACNKPILTFED
jgi:hypothetical protein